MTVALSPFWRAHAVWVACRRHSPPITGWIPPWLQSVVLAVLHKRVEMVPRKSTDPRERAGDTCFWHRSEERTQPELWVAWKYKNCDSVRRNIKIMTLWLRNEVWTTYFHPPYWSLVSSLDWSPPDSCWRRYLSTFALDSKGAFNFSSGSLCFQVSCLFVQVDNPVS